MNDAQSIHHGFYIDGSTWPNTSQQQATERTYRDAFLTAVREAAQWSLWGDIALQAAGTERRQRRKRAETDIDGGIVTYRPSHLPGAAQARGRV